MDILKYFLGKIDDLSKLKDPDEIAVKGDGIIREYISCMPPEFRKELDELNEIIIKERQFSITAKKKMQTLKSFFLEKHAENKFFEAELVMLHMKLAVIWYEVGFKMTAEILRKQLAEMDKEEEKKRKK